MVNKICKIVGGLGLLIVLFLIGYQFGTNHQINVAKTQKDIYVSDELKKWYDNVARATKTKEDVIIEWSLNSYAKVLSEHIELAKKYDWYSYRERLLIFDLAIVKANLAHYYRKKNNETRAQSMIKESFDLMEKRDPVKYRNIDELWSFTEKRLLFDLSSISADSGKKKSEKENKIE